MDSPDSTGAGLLHSLNAVVTFLHSEGFYAAEESLLREIENRYPAPDAISPRHISASPGSSGGGGAGIAAATSAQQQRRRQTVALQQGDTVDFQPALAAAHSLPPVDSMESAEK